MAGAVKSAWQGACLILKSNPAYHHVPYLAQLRAICTWIIDSHGDDAHGALSHLLAISVYLGPTLSISPLLVSLAIFETIALMRPHCSC